MFSPRTLEFIAENHWMNSRAWFTEHKSEYTEFVQKPLVELCNTLAPVVEEIDPKLITDPRSSVSRIYRDMRFARGEFYRDTLWISFRRDKQAFPCWPEFYFVISPKEFFYGCGYYCTKADVMKEMRRLIIESHPKFLVAKAVLEAHNSIYLDGDMYKRSKHREYPEGLRNWLDRKSVCFSCKPKNAEELFSEDLAEHISNAFKKMKPLYDFCVYAEAEAMKTE